MNEIDYFARMEINLLAQHCSTETRRFFKGITYDARYCFELLCRACRDLNEAALSHVYAIYLPMLAARARRHSIFHRSCQDADAFVRTALANFYNAVRGERFLQKFSTLPEALAYLYACLSSEILQDVRKNRRIQPIDDSPPAPPEASTLELKELWQHICRLLPDETMQRLAYLRFVLDMKPAAIVEQYPAVWTTQREVSIAIYRIRQILRKDDYLRGLAGFSDEGQDGQPDSDTEN